MRRLILSLSSIFIISFQFAIGQNEKIVIGVTTFSRADYIEDKYVNELTETVIDEFVKSKRFTIVDRTKLNVITTERELQKTEDFIDSKVVSQGKTLGAQYIVAGHFISIGTNKQFSSQYQQYVTTARVILSLKMIDVETGEVVYAETFGKGNSSGTTSGLFSTPSPCDLPGSGISTAAAIKQGISNIGCGVNKWLRKFFPYLASVVEIQELHKRKGAQKILITAGKSLDLTPNKRLAVVELIKVNVDGKEITRQKNIGILEVKKIEDDNFSICNVIDGGDIIAEKMQQKANLKVIIQ